MKEEKRCQDCGSRLAEELDGACPACLWGDSLPEDTDGLAIGEEIARGGMGIVYRAWQAEPNRAVAAACWKLLSVGVPGKRSHTTQMSAQVKQLAAISSVPDDCRAVGTG